VAKDEVGAPNVLVRAATADDAATVVGFIRGLAAYERMLDEVKITEADVVAALFGPGPRAFCDIAESGGAPVGFAFWFYNFSTFEGRFGVYLEDIFVVPEARGTGAGLALMRRLARRCRDEGLARLEWQVLDWNALAIGFYDRLGAGAKTQWITRSLSGAALAALAQD
jgi:GNAT superfamily N-acetyltransferase